MGDGVDLGYILREALGYLGTAIVLLSFTMRNIKWLRIVNMIGSVICIIYACMTNTLPQAVLNGSLILINGAQLAKIILDERRKKESISNA